MTFKMPKPVYQILLGALMLTFVAAACDNKKGGKEKEATEDSIKVKPVDPGTNEPVDPGNKPTGDTIKKKPVDPGT